jgi:hypothetical protein
MSWLVSGSEKTAVDRLGIQNVTVLLHADGSPITDASPAATTITTAGGGPTIDASTKKFGAGSLSYDGIDDRAYFTSGIYDDFTVECWFNTNSGSTTQYIFGLGVAGLINARIQSSNIVSVRYGTGSAVSTGISINTWYHLVVTRSAGATKCFLDGVDFTSTLSQTAGPTASHTFGIGSNGISATTPFNGFIDEFRFTRNVARYTSAFTPPTAPFPDI